jgi:hypothetical protein
MPLSPQLSTHTTTLPRVPRKRTNRHSKRLLPSPCLPPHPHTAAAAGLPQEAIPACRIMKQQLLATIATLQLPPNSLDVLVDSLGAPPPPSQKHIHRHSKQLPLLPIPPAPPPCSHNTAAAAGLPQEAIPACRTMKQQLLATIATLQLPPNFLDVLVDSMGVPPLFTKAHTQTLKTDASSPHHSCPPPLVPATQLLQQVYPKRPSPHAAP